jgi:hypothetical protein
MLCAGVTSEFMISQPQIWCPLHCLVPATDLAVAYPAAIGRRSSQLLLILAYSALRKSDAKSGQWVVIGMLLSDAFERNRSLTCAKLEQEVA